MRDYPFELRPMTGALGAEVYGVNLKADLDDDLVGQLRSAWLEYAVLAIREQNLEPEDLVRVANAFGVAAEYPFIDGLPGTPEVTEILKTETDSSNFGGGWHSDTAYMDNPAMATMLYAIELPDCGGDTLFASMTGAYDSLSPGYQSLLADMRAVFSSDKGGPGARARTMAALRGMKGGYIENSGTLEAEHPAVRTHPETGAKSMYLNIAHSVRFSDMTADESSPMIKYLCTHATRPEMTCRLRWQPGTLAFWDNRCTQHYALNDYAGKRRRMHRVTIAGDRPY